MKSVPNAILQETTDRLKTCKAKLHKLQVEVARLKGRRSELLRTLREEFGVGSVEEALRLRDATERELLQLSQQINKQLDEFERTYRKAIKATAE